MAYSHGEPTAEEQYLLELINRARANPAAEGRRLAITTDPDIVTAMRYYHITGASLVRDFTNYPAKPPLAFHPSLIQSARAHSTDMAVHNFQDHRGSDGSTFPSRLLAAGYSGGIDMNESIYAYALSPDQGHASFVIDWGVASLAHRKIMFNYVGSVFNEIGIGLVRASGQVGPWVLTQDYGLRRPVSYIVGVVYRDKDHNGFYSVGEGIKGVTIMPDSGMYYTVTSTSGGYALPLSSTNGMVTLTYSGDVLTNIYRAMVVLDGRNQKVDLDTSHGLLMAPTPPKLSIVRSGWQPDGRYEMTLFLASNQRVVLQNSVNLLNWYSVATNTPSQGIVSFHERLDGDAARRYFRVMVLP
jgi:hypothetical protein